MNLRKLLETFDSFHIVKRIVPVLFIIMVVVFVATHGMFDFVMRRAMRTNGPALLNRTVISFRVDDNFTMKERALIFEAFAEIKRVSGCIELTASFVRIPDSEMLLWRSDKYATIYKVSQSTWVYHVARYLTGAGSYMGMAIITTGDIFIMSSENDDGVVDFKNTIIHEILHVVFRNSWHSSHKGSLMYYNIGGGKQKLLDEEITKLRAMCVMPKVQKVVFHEIWISRGHSDARLVAVPGTTRRMVQ